MILKHSSFNIQNLIIMDYYEFLEVYFKFRVTLSMGILNMFGIYKYYLLFILEDCLGFA